APNASVPSLPQPAAADSRVFTPDCAVGAPYDEANPPSTTLGALEQQVVPPYPIKVNKAPPGQEPGHAPPPSGPLCGRHGHGPHRSRHGSGKTAHSHHRTLTALGTHAVTTGRFDGVIATFSFSDRSASARDF